MQVARFILAIGLNLGIASLAAAAAPHNHATVPVASTTERMFAWWNGQMRAGTPFTNEGLGRFFSDDAVLNIDGAVVASGLAAITAHFARIQGSGAQVEIVVPFLETFAAKGREYTFHVIRSRRNGTPRCMLAAGHSVIVNGRIKEISLVRTIVQPGSSPAAQACWQA